MIILIQDILVSAARTLVCLLQKPAFCRELREQMGRGSHANSGLNYIQQDVDPL